MVGFPRESRISRAPMASMIDKICLLVMGGLDAPDGAKKRRRNAF
jgi:hypothetical protein